MPYARALMAFLLAAAPAAQDAIFTFRGAQAGEQLGTILAFAGDVDRDGHADLIFGLPLAGAAGIWSGRALLRSGRHGGVQYEFAGLAAGDRFGSTVTDAGDVDGDGFGDVAVGAPFDDRGGADAGSITIFSGRDGAVLRTSFGPFPGASFGLVLDGGRDVDGDGRGDLAVGMPLADFNGTDSGSVYVLSGVSGAQLARYDGAAAQDHFGYTVALVGDADGDGRSEVAGGAIQPFGGPGYVRVHRSGNGAVLWTGFGDGFVDRTGWSLAAAGDVDNDGRADVIAGLYGRTDAHFDHETQGGARVWSGATGAVLHTFDGLTSFERFGAAVAAAGDVDGDGRGDVAVGPDFAGFVRIYAGSNGAVLRTINGGGAFGSRLDGARDANGDGRPDLLIGARWDATNGAEAGAAYVVSPTPLTLRANGHRVSLAAGGSVTFTLAAGSAFAGRLYLLIGSLSGISPGINLGPITLPLNFDGYFLATLNNPNAFPLTNSAGTLNGSGGAVASFALPAGFGAVPPGTLFDHAYLLVPAPGFDFTSNAVVIRIDP
jgi:hypothetical protein